MTVKLIETVAKLHLCMRIGKEALTLSSTRYGVELKPIVYNPDSYCGQILKEYEFRVSHRRDFDYFTLSKKLVNDFGNDLEPEQISEVIEIVLNKDYLEQFNPSLKDYLAKDYREALDCFCKEYPDILKTFPNKYKLLFFL